MCAAAIVSMGCTENEIDNLIVPDYELGGTIVGSDDTEDDADEDVREPNIDITFTPEQLALPGKKGHCAKTMWSKPVALNCYWHYTWKNDLLANYPFESLYFIPMMWGGTNTEAVRKNVQDYIDAGLYHHILGHNEPDKKDQSNMTVEKSLSAWEGLMEFGLPLGSPVVASDYTWLDDFMTQIKEKGWRVDFICMHHYGGTSVSAFTNKIANLHKKYGLPILITEFAVADWNTGGDITKNKYYGKTDQIKAFMKGALEWMEKTDYVMGYSWFSFGENDAAGGPSALFGAGNQLTELGEFYRDFNYTPEQGGGVVTTPDAKGTLVKGGNFETAANFGEWSYDTRFEKFVSDELKGGLGVDERALIDGAGTLRILDGGESVAVQQKIAVTPSYYYDVEYTGRIQSSAGSVSSSLPAAGESLTIKIYDANGTEISLDKGSLTSTTNVDTSYSAGFFAPIGCSEVTLSIESTGGAAYVDKVAMFETEVISVSTPVAFSSRSIYASEVLNDIYNKTWNATLVTDTANREIVKLTGNGDKATLDFTLAADESEFFLGFSARVMSQSGVSTTGTSVSLVLYDSADNEVYRTKSISSYGDGSVAERGFNLSAGAYKLAVECKSGNTTDLCFVDGIYFSTPENVLSDPHFDGGEGTTSNVGTADADGWVYDKGWCLKNNAAYAKEDGNGVLLLGLDNLNNPDNVTNGFSNAGELNITSLKVGHRYRLGATARVQAKPGYPSGEQPAVNCSVFIQLRTLKSGFTSGTKMEDYVVTLTGAGTDAGETFSASDTEIYLDIDYTAAANLGFVFQKTHNKLCVGYCDNAYIHDLGEIE